MGRNSTFLKLISEMMSAASMIRIIIPSAYTGKPRQSLKIHMIAFWIRGSPGRVVLPTAMKSLMMEVAIGGS